MKFLAFTLDLESDYAGQVNQYEIFKYPAKIEEVLARLHLLNVKITVFVVGEILEKYPHIVKLFKKYGCEFEVHSYSHKKDKVSLDEEIERAQLAYYNYFKQYPKGYRAPQGRISKEVIKLLEKKNFLYDSSIFPSYYPNPLRYLLRNKNIHCVKDSSIVEIPLTAVTPFRFTLSLSYIKLLGMRFYSNLFRFFNLPNFICFNVHLHDFIVVEDSYRRLPLFWKFVYGRNKFSGTNYCIRFLKYIKEQGYRFCFMSEVYDRYKKQ